MVLESQRLFLPLLRFRLKIANILGAGLIVGMGCQSYVMAQFYGNLKRGSLWLKWLN